MIDPSDAKLSAEKLVALINPMGEDAIKAVAWREDETSQAALREVAADAKRNVAIRQTAVVGLARSALASAPTKDVLRSILFARDLPTELRLESLRSLRGALGAVDAEKLVQELMTAATKDQVGLPIFDEPEWASQIVLAFKPNPDALSAEQRKRLEILLPKRPADTASWQAITKEGGDAIAGQKVFALATGARCYICHQHDNRGGVVGPDLSGVGRAMDRAKLVESILEPSKEVAPLYVSTVIELKNGDTISGVNLPEAGANFVSIADASGKRIRVKADDIASRRPEKLSVMPEGLVDSMSVKEFQDLIAYLAK